MSETIYGDIKPIKPIYVVETDDGICHVSATECLIDPEWKVVCFCIGDSVQAIDCFKDVVDSLSNAYNEDFGE